MIWLVVLALGGWVLSQAIQIGRLKTRSQWLERRLLDLKDRLEPIASPPPSPAPNADSAAPRPEPSVQPRTAPPSAAEAPQAETPRPKPSGPPPRERMRNWLEENGLAWAGGAALALGGLFLVTYAAQRGVFTPPLRIGTAVGVGALLLGASEWLKRRSSHPLAAAVAAGAGAATLYGAVWASYWLYNFIGLGAAGGLLAVVSAGLLGLAFRQGEPLAVLAVLAGMLAPAVTGPEQWTAPALTAYLALITLTGYGAAGLRRWGLAGLATLVGAAGWAFAGFAAEGYVRVTALALAPLVLAGAAVAWRRRQAPAAPSPPGRLDLFGLMPALALGVGAVLLSLLSAARPDESTAGQLVHAAGAGAAMFAFVCAVLVRRTLIPAWLFALGSVPALAFAWLFAQTFEPAAREAWGLGLIAVLALAGVVGATGRTDAATRISAGGAALAGLVLALAIGGPLTATAPWAPAVIAATILLGAAIAMARSSPDPVTDMPLAFWIWAAGAAGLWSLHQGVEAAYLPVAASALGLVAAGLHARLGWRGLAGVMLGGATASLAALMAPDLFDAVAERQFPIWGLALVAAASVSLTYGGAWIARRARRPVQSADAQSTAAVLIAVTGIGLLLRLAASAPADGGDLDLFMEASLRSLAILAAGLVSAQAVRTDSSLIGRWRGQVLLCLGLGHVLVFQAAALNPVFAEWKPAVAGPPILDALLVGFLAPAALLAIATWKRVAINRPLLAFYASGAGLLSFAWAVLETRRLFQGASLSAGFDAIGRAEAGAYAVIGLGAALAAMLVTERAAGGAWTVSSLAKESGRAGRWGAWAALIFALVVFGYAASPWWGPINRPLAGLQATALLLAVYAAGAAGAFMIAVAATRVGDTLLSRASRISVVIIAFALLNLVVRLAFRGFDMRPNQSEASLETWAFSAIWGLYGFGLLIWGGVRRSNDLRAAGLAALGVTLAKIFLFDMDRLDGAIRAASFLAVGALLLAAAVIMRRLGGDHTAPLGRGARRAAPAIEP